MTIVDRRYSVAEGTAIKAPCRVGTTANITLSGLQTIDGVAVVADDRVLVKNQTTGSENGIYTASTGNWLRTRDFDGAYDVVTGSRVLVTAGSTQAGNEYYISTTGTITIDSTSIAFTEMPVPATLTAAVAAAEASAALAATSAAALGNQVHQYDTRTQAAAANIPVGVNAVRTLGLTAVGDGGGAEYIRGLSGDPGDFQDAGGAYWTLASVTGDVVALDTRVSAAAGSYAATVNIIITGGYTTAGDGGGAIYKRGISSSPGAFQDAEGVYWGLDLGAGVVLASWFGAVGDDSTNDYTALQAGITAAQAAKTSFHFNPGKKYYVSGGDLTVAIPSGCLNFFIHGNGAQIRTNSAEARTALIIQHATAVTRVDQNRKVVVSGLTINHFDNANALYGINVIGSQHVAIRDCSFVGGSDTGVAMSVNYASIRFGHSDATNPDTGSFWGRVQNCDWIAGSTRIPNGIHVQGGNNALLIENNSISLCTIGILMSNASSGLNADEAVIANGVRILSNDFEGCNFGVYVQGTAGWSAIHGLIVAHNRIESITTVFFNYLLDTAPFAPPIIGPNYIDSASWPPKYVSSANGLAVDVRDAFVGHLTQDPGSLAAETTFTLTPITVNGAAAGDCVTVETSADLQGISMHAYVSAANTVTIRCANPTSAAIDLGSTKWTVRVRPQY